MTTWKLTAEVTDTLRRNMSDFAKAQLLSIARTGAVAELNRPDGADDIFSAPDTTDATIADLATEYRSAAALLDGIWPDSAPHDFWADDLSDAIRTLKAERAEEAIEVRGGVVDRGIA